MQPFNSFPMISLSIKTGRPRFLVFKGTFLNSYMAGKHITTSNNL